MALLLGSCASLGQRKRSFRCWGNNQSAWGSTWSLHHLWTNFQIIWAVSNVKLFQRDVEPWKRGTCSCWASRILIASGCNPHFQQLIKLDSWSSMPMDHCWHYADFFALWTYRYMRFSPMKPPCWLVGFHFYTTIHPSACVPLLVSGNWSRHDSWWVWKVTF